MGRCFALLALLGAAVVSSPLPAQAAGIEVQPISVELSAKLPSDMLAISNRGLEPVRFQVMAFEWKQKPSGEMEFAPTQDIMFFPAMMTLNPQEARNLRVGATIKPGDKEKTYRIFIQELPRMIVPDDPNGAAVGMLTKVSVPVFIQPAAPNPAPGITGLSMSGNTVRFSIKNSGNAHVRPKAVSLKVKDAASQLVHEETLRSWYVLAGGVLEFEAKIPAQVCSTASSVEIDMELEKRKSQQAALANVKCSL